MAWWREAAGVALSGGLRRIRFSPAWGASMICGLALVMLVGLLAFESEDGPGQAGMPGGRPTSTAPERPRETPKPSGSGTVTTMAELRAPKALHFGVSTPGSPNEPETETVATAAGRRPTVQEYFVNWNQEFEPDRVTESYRLGAVPVVTWQPSAGKEAGEDQPTYALRLIASGAHDAYIARFADSVKSAGRPVVIRFAHEMNAEWYPWSEQHSGNRPGDFVDAWRHVYDVFATRKVANALWFWCPNIHRGTNKHELARYFPGDKYVDWIGMDGYSESETSAGQVFDETYEDLVSLSRKPIFIGETGVKPTPNKALWTVDFFRWIKNRPQLVGFSWFQHSDQEGGRFDWRFTTSPGALKAFQDGLADQNLVSWPMS